MQGMGVSLGISIGRAVVVKDHAMAATGILLENEDDIAREIQKYKEAVSLSIGELQLVIAGAGDLEVDILETHIELLSDPQMESDVLEKIRTEKKNARDAVVEVIGAFAQVFINMNDDYLRERAADVQDVGKRILRNLHPGQTPLSGSIPSDEATFILVADDLSPSETITMDTSRVIGFVTRLGGATSHAAIIARSRAIPAVVGCGDGLEEIKDGDILILDGGSGLVLINPDADITAAYMAKRTEFIEKVRRLQSEKDTPAATTDGMRIKLLANIATVADLESALQQGAEGVGLLRTELVFMQRESFPSEDEQFVFYRNIALRSGGFPVTIRTIDIGGDKPLPYFRLPEEQNPFLGYRAIRICLDRQDIFLTQLKAILRASAFGKLKILFPMISNVQEIRSAKAILARAKNELLESQIPFDTDIPAGIMIEIPSAAIMADLLAKEVDFFSIGTNDLCQYTLAVDRMNEKIKDLYDPFNPAVLRLIQHTIVQAHKHNIPVSLCGELAADPGATLLLIGMGLEEFSMNSPSIPAIKNIILHTSRAEAAAVCKQMME
jgi:phosphoenolpyruvate-protein phosphotransferase (PTS system enzyme I)